MYPSRRAARNSIFIVLRSLFAVLAETFGTNESRKPTIDRFSISHRSASARSPRKQRNLLITFLVQFVRSRFTLELFLAKPDCRVCFYAGMRQAFGRYLAVDFIDGFADSSGVHFALGNLL